MLATVEIDNNYMMSSHLGEWQKAYQEYQFKDAKCDLKAELPIIHE